MDEAVKRLEAKVVELEKKLGSMPARAEATSLTPEEMQTYQKVRDVIAADYGEFCGINDCFRVTQRCVTSSFASFRCIVRCINECVCGPCSACYNSGGGGGGSFGGFGG